jgi:hypothetical protein
VLDPLAAFVDVGSEQMHVSVGGEPKVFGTCGRQLRANDRDRNQSMCQAIGLAVRRAKGQFSDAAGSRRALRTCCTWAFCLQAILPKELRVTRDLARKRMQLVRSRTTHILAVENITARQYGSRISSNQVRQLHTEDIDIMSSISGGRM